MSNEYLCSYCPIIINVKGRLTVQRTGLPPFIDGSCRREPDFEAAFPSISALCRAGKFAPRLRPGDRVAYITRRSMYDGEIGWALVALLRILHRFESHQAAAEWYGSRGYPFPSNCLVKDNPPKPLDQTHQIVPREVFEGIGRVLNPDRVIRKWDGGYKQRAKTWGTFLVCEANYLELWHPPILRKKDFFTIFGRMPGTQNPGALRPREFAALEERCYRT
jgi:hypothetical protein